MKPGRVSPLQIILLVMQWARMFRRHQELWEDYGYISWPLVPPVRVMTEDRAAMLHRSQGQLEFARIQDLAILLRYRASRASLRSAC